MWNETTTIWLMGTETWAYTKPTKFESGCEISSGCKTKHETEGERLYEMKQEVKQIKVQKVRLQNNEEIKLDQSAKTQNNKVRNFVHDENDVSWQAFKDLSALI